MKEKPIEPTVNERMSFGGKLLLSVLRPLRPLRSNRSGESEDTPDETEDGPRGRGGQDRPYRQGGTGNDDPPEDPDERG